MQFIPWSICLTELLLSFTDTFIFVQRWRMNYFRISNQINKGKSKTLLVKGRGGPEGCETSRLPHFLDNRLTDGGEVISLTRRQAALYPPRKIPSTHFY
jgi:hypothetical protein